MNNSYDNEDYHTVKLNDMYVIDYKLNRYNSGINHISAMELCNDSEQAIRIKDIEVAELIAESVNGIVLLQSVVYIKQMESIIIRDYAQEDN